MIIHAHYTQQAIYGEMGRWGGGGGEMDLYHPSLLTCGMESTPSALSFSFIMATLARVDSDLDPLTTACGHKNNDF